MLGFEKHTEVEKYIEASKLKKQERIFMVCSLFIKDRREKKRKCICNLHKCKKKGGGGNPETTEIDLIQGVGRNG